MLLNDSSTSDKSGAVERKSSKVEACSVCGDQSTGYHYEVASCNGCKTFFRRTITAHRTYKCHKNGNCVFNKDIRCACRACRFAKCLAVGMNPKAIQCNRTTKPSSSANFSEENMVSELQTCSNNCPEQCASYYTTDKSLIISQTNNSATSISAGKSPYTVSALLGLTRNNMSTNSSDERLSVSSCSKDEKYFLDSEEQLAKRMHADNNDKVIEDFLKLQQCLDAIYSSRYEISDSILDALSKPSVLDDYDKISMKNCHEDMDVAEEINIRVALVIEYAKSFDVFRRMPLEDKIYLLRDVALIIELLENAYKILNDNESWSDDVQDAGVECRKRSYRSNLIQNIQDEKSSEVAIVLIVLESLSRAKLDQTEFVLFKAIVFLHSECFNLSSESCIQLLKSRQKMLGILFQYMLNTHGKQGPVKYGNLLSILWTLLRISQSYREAITKLHLKPLCKEILSLKMPERLM